MSTVFEKLTALANSIRSKTGGTEPLTLDGMTEAVNGLSTGGGENIDALIDRSITEISSNVTSIGNYSFHSCQSLKEANFPLVTSIGSYAFNSNYALTELNFPLVTSIDYSAFNGCQSLKEANFPLATSIGGYAFYSNYALTELNFPLVTSINYSAFYNCQSLKEVNFPLVTSIGDSTFRNCYVLPEANFPLATSIGGYAFYNCQSLTRLILRSETLCTISNTNAFGNCYHILGTVNATYNPEGLADGYIYVPKALIEDYKVETNWITYASQFRALEDYTVDGTTTGELDESKI